MHVSKHLRALAVIAVAGVLAVGCTPGGDETTPTTDAGPPSEPTGTLKVNWGNGVPSWAPGSGTDTGYMRVPYETLLRLGEDLEILPNLATEWEQTPNSVTLTLRDDVTFHDGTPFNAEAVKANIEYVRDNPGQFAGPLQAVASVDIVDEHTAKVNLKFPAPSFLTMLTQRNVFMASPAALADGSITTAPVGTGPWAYDGANSIEGTKWSFTLVDDYWGELPYYENVELYAIADDAAAAAAVMSGEIDLTDTEDDQLPTLEADPNIETLEYPALRNNLFFFDRGPGGVFEDADVRRALCYAIDDDGMQALPEGGIFATTGQHFLEDDPGYNPDIEGYPQNLDEANELLDGRTVEATLPAAPFLKQQAEYLADQMNQLDGVNITVQDLPIPEFVSTWNSGQYPIGLGQAAQLTPYDFYSSWFSANARSNPSGLESPELAAAAQAAIAAGDSAEATQLWQDVMKVVIDDEALGCGYAFIAELLAWNTTAVGGVTQPGEIYEINLVNLREVYPIDQGD